MGWDPRGTKVRIVAEGNHFGRTGEIVSVMEGLDESDNPCTLLAVDVGPNEVPIGCEPQDVRVVGPLPETVPCVYGCGDAPLEWRTQYIDGVSVHRVPVYICPVCGDESVELNVGVAVEGQVEAALKAGMAEITLVLLDE